MTQQRKRHIILANGASGPRKRTSKHTILNYLDGQHPPNVRIGLPSFVQNVNHIPPRILDLLEMAGYIFAADRSFSRGSKEAVEYQAWSRSIEFHIRVSEKHKGRVYTFCRTN